MVKEVSCRSHDGAKSSPRSISVRVNSTPSVSPLALLTHPGSSLEAAINPTFLYGLAVPVLDIRFLEIQIFIHIKVYANK